MDWKRNYHTHTDFCDGQNTPEEMDYIVQNVKEVVSYLREISPVWDELQKGERPHLI